MQSFFLQFALSMVVTALVTGIFILWRNRRLTRGVKSERALSREGEKLSAARKISLKEPLSEKTRPRRFADIVGQEDGLRALRAALLGKNPHHVIIYGPPGVGKTAAARLVMEEARKSFHSAFGTHAPFIEVDAATVRFDERGITDPLLGSVHDPIYQGAGNLGASGVPQPKPGAVNRAHGGVLFLDEIGELHPIQMNRLLKVLEDRKTMPESSYYDPDKSSIPAHIRDMFEQGIPADFRLVGATTRSPEELPSALRSRCVEIYFKPLKPRHLMDIQRRAAAACGLAVSEETLAFAARYVHSGREAVNLMQLSASLALNEERDTIEKSDVAFIAECGHLAITPQKKLRENPLPGEVNALAVSGPGMGVILELETTVMPRHPGMEQLTVTGIIEEEELKDRSGLKRRSSTAKSAARNAITALGRCMDVDLSDVSVHVNYPGGIPVDGPSSGLATAVSIVSALQGKPVPARIAMTGEISVTGRIKAVGGIREKVEAAISAGAAFVLIPLENREQALGLNPEHIRLVSTLTEAMDLVFGPAVMDLPAPGKAAVAFQASGEKEI